MKVMFKADMEETALWLIPLRMDLGTWTLRSCCKALGLRDIGMTGPEMSAGTVEVLALTTEDQ